MQISKTNFCYCTEVQSFLDSNLRIYEEYCIMASIQSLVGFDKLPADRDKFTGSTTNLLIFIFFSYDIVTLQVYRKRLQNYGKVQ